MNSGNAERGDAEQRARRAAACSLEPFAEHVRGPEERLNVGRVVVQPYDIAEREPGLAEHRLQVVERQRDLSAHVAGVHRLPVCVTRRLAGAEDDALDAGQRVRLDEAELVLPGPRIDDLTLHALLLRRSFG